MANKHITSCFFFFFLLSGAKCAEQSPVPLKSSDKMLMDKKGEALAAAEEDKTGNTDPSEPENEDEELKVILIESLKEGVKEDLLPVLQGIYVGLREELGSKEKAIRRNAKHQFDAQREKLFAEKAAECIANSEGILGQEDTQAVLEAFQSIPGLKLKSIRQAMLSEGERDEYKNKNFLGENGLEEMPFSHVEEGDMGIVHNHRIMQDRGRVQEEELDGGEFVVPNALREFLLRNRGDDRAFASHQPQEGDESPIASPSPSSVNSSLPASPRLPPAPPDSGEDTAKREDLIRQILAHNGDSGRLQYTRAELEGKNLHQLGAIMALKGLAPLSPHKKRLHERKNPHS